MGVLFGTEIRQYWWENNAKFFAVYIFKRKVVHNYKVYHKTIHAVILDPVLNEYGTSAIFPDFTE